MLSYVNAYSPDKGLVTAYPGSNIVVDAVTDCKNAQFERQLAIGRPELRPYIQLAVEGAPYAIVRFLTFDQRAFTILLTSSHIYRLDPSVPSWVSIGDSLYTGIEWSYVVTLNQVVFTNGIEPVKIWNGVGNVSNLGIPYIANFVAYFKDHLFLLSTVEAGQPILQRVRWSNVGTLNDFDTGTAGFVDLVDDSSEITGVGILGDALLIYKKWSIVECRWTGSTFSFRTLIHNRGLISRRGLIAFSYKHIFVSHDGVYSALGTSNIEKLSELVNDIWTNKDMLLTKTIAAYDIAEQTAYFILPRISGNQDVLSLHLDFGSWSKHNYYWNIGALGLFTFSEYIRWHTNPWGTWDNARARWHEGIISGDIPSMLIMDDAGLTYELNRSKYGDVGQWSFQTKDFVPTEEPEHIRRLTRWEEFSLEALLSSVSHIHIHYSIDKGKTIHLISKLTLPASQWKRYTVNFDVTAETIRFFLVFIGQVRVRWLQAGYVGRRAYA